MSVAAVCGATHEVAHQTAAQRFLVLHQPQRAAGETLGQTLLDGDIW